MVDSRFSPNSQRHFKRNFSDVMEALIPRYYILEDKNAFGEKVDVLDTIIKFHLETAETLSTILSLPEGTLFVDLDTFDGIEPFFNKKNRITDIDKFKFESKILYPLNKSFRDFPTVESFRTYLETSLIPELRASRSDPDAVDSYIRLLGWFYLLATTSDIAAVQPYSIVVDYFCDYLYKDKHLGIVEGINALTDYIWKNRFPYIPTDFRKGDGEYVSGTQQLDKLKTINEVLYSESYLNKLDEYVATNFELYANTGEPPQNLVSNGAFWRLIKAFSFSVADRQDEVNQLKTLYDIQECPDEYLPELANLIGWNLLGYDKNKWRLQLANAVSVYKRTGTKQSIQIVLDNLFGEGGIDLNSHIQELWESYLPFLIMYALATESVYFENFTTFTREISESLGIDNYDTKNFENNIRASVDKILLNLYSRFPNNFRLANQPFPEDSDNFVFHYRGKVHPIPPFEEIPYYVTSDVTKPFLDALEDLLVCFGVNPEFATTLIEYVKANSLDNQNNIATDNSWLLFTSSLELAPNWDRIVNLPDKNKSEYLSLWNGKSSHFKLDFSGTEFDFNKIQFTPDSKYAILMASRAAQEFSPAHAIPLITAYLEDESDYTASGNLFTEISRDPIDYPPQTNNLRDIAIDVLQGLTEFSGLGRQRLASLYAVSSNTISNPGVTFNTTDTIPINRKTTRRRNYKNALNLAGYFDRSGFNPPIFRSSRIPGITVVEDSELITKGLIPSSLEFVSTSATCDGLLSSIPDIYKQCIPNKNGLFYGYYLSSTIPTRGIPQHGLDLNGSALYQDRDQLDPFMYVIYKIEQKKLEAQAYRTATTLLNRADYAQKVYWFNLSGSEANKRLSCEDTALNSIEGYYNYSFGRKIHQLYREYVTTFNFHPLTTQVYGQNPTDVLTHCFGSILKNSDFQDRGANGAQVYTRDSSNIIKLNTRSDTFGPSLGNGSYSVAASSALVARTSRDNYSGTYEVINSTLIDGVDMIHTSGASTENEFVIYDLANFDETSYIRENVFVKMRSVNGLPRLRFHVSGSDFTDPSGTFRQNTFLSPNHKFKLSLKGLASFNDGTGLTDAEIGVWIHTELEGNDSYHYDSDGNWVKLGKGSITVDKVLRDLTHKASFDTQGYTKADELGAKVFRCLRADNDPESELSNLNDSVALFEEKYFSEVSFEFDTFTGCGSLQTSSLHNPNQHYVIEVFMIPKRENLNQFILLDEISLRDETLWDYTRIELAGALLGPLFNRYCDPIRMDLSEEDIRTIIKTFARFAGKDRSDGFLSRYSEKSKNVHGVGGGNRDSYRNLIQMSNIAESVRNSNGQITLIDIKDFDSQDFLEGGYSPSQEVAEAIDTVPVEGENPFENVEFGFWIG